MDSNYNRPLVDQLFQGGKPPEIDVKVSFEKKSIWQMIGSAMIGAIVFILVSKYLFKK